MNNCKEQKISFLGFSLINFSLATLYIENITRWEEIKETSVVWNVAVRATFQTVSATLMPLNINRSLYISIEDIRRRYTRTHYSRYSLYAGNGVFTCWNVKLGKMSAPSRRELFSFTVFYKFPYSALTNVRNLNIRFSISFSSSLCAYY